MKAVGLIPARMESSRFPGKPLVEIEGLPMVVHVLKRSELCKNISEVYVATDSAEISKAVNRFGGKTIMTSKSHKTGTDRIAEAVDTIDCDLVVNIQGDEPLVRPEDIDKLIGCIKDDPDVKFATLVCKTYKFNDVTECKVVLGQNNDILYMSRADIPSNSRTKADYLYKLYCVVAFQKTFLKKFASWPQTPLEKIEYIEYLRIIENGHRMRAVVIEEYTTSVDTPDDLKTVNDLMKKDKIKYKYL